MFIYNLQRIELSGVRRERYNTGHRSAPALARGLISGGFAAIGLLFFSGTVNHATQTTHNSCSYTCKDGLAHNRHISGLYAIILCSNDTNYNPHETKGPDFILFLFVCHMFVF